MNDFRRQIKKNNKQNDSKKKTIAKTQDIEIKKINLFKDDKKDNYYNIYKDEKSMYQIRPTDRNRRSSLIEIECDSCEEAFNVSKTLLRRDEESGNYLYTCDDCITRRRK